MVFKNCPHLAPEITNLTQDNLSKTKLTFLLVDPEKPLKDTIYL